MSNVFVVFVKLFIKFKWFLIPCLEVFKTESDKTFDFNLAKHSSLEELLAEELGV